MTFAQQRDAILVHAQAAALSANATFTNVAVGPPLPTGSKGCRVFYDGEDDAPRMPFQESANGTRLIGHIVGIVAWWSTANLATSAMAALEDEIFAFIDALRTALTADQTLGGTAISLDIRHAQRLFVLIGSTRYETTGLDVVVGHTEYTA